ncbi:MAG TPA: hypothetical protein VM658_21940 [bacterium]|nr:hypothetical protein [bacterium]
MTSASWGPARRVTRARCGPRGNYYLTAGNSPCINAGSGTAFSLGMDLFTTDISGMLDSATVDMGYHYMP